MIDKELIQKSSAIFDKLDKWNAFLELEQLHEAIRKNWFEFGTKKLRDYFTQNPSEGWCWDHWDSTTDTRWFLKDFKHGLQIGFGWQYKGFYLFLWDQKIFDTKQLDEQLKDSKYVKLLMLFGGVASQDSTYKATENTIFNFGNPFSGNNPVDEFAWYAFHETDAFVKQAASKIEAFTRNPEMTLLLTGLNNAIKK